jgi:hypothetical protein
MAMAGEAPLNINLMNLCLEILDNEHDLNRATGEINPLYIYCYNHISDGTLRDIFTSHTYPNANRLTSINPKQILQKMKFIVRQRTGSFIPAGAIPGGASSDITYKYEEFIISYEKTFEKMLKMIRDRDRQIGQCIAETYRGVGTEPTNTADGLVKVYRSELTTQFDNSCTWTHPNVNLNNDTIIGSVDVLSLNRIYDNYFPKAASVFVYGSELMNPDATGAIINLIRVNIATSTSVLPFEAVELDEMRGKLTEFIRYNTDNIDASKLYLLHIFKNFEQTTGKTGGGPIPPQYSFSLQWDQVELNEVSMELYGYNKRGSNILCSPQAVSTINSKMIFSQNIPPYMRNCHISYGKLCGDGVTIFATKKAHFTDKPSMYNAVISIDEFCCLRAVYAGIIVAYQQKPSAMARTGLGMLSDTRNHGIFQVGNAALNATEAAALDAAEAEKAAKAALEAAAEAEKTALDTAAIELILNIANIFKNNESLSIDEFVQIFGDNSGIIMDIYNYNIADSHPETYDEGMITHIKAYFHNSLNINIMVDFCINYNNILTNIKNITTTSFRSRSATNQTQSNMEDLFGGLGTLETLIQTYITDDDEYYKISRRHIVYIMITQLFTKRSFISKIQDFIRYMFGIQEPPTNGLIPDATSRYSEFMVILGANGENIIPANYKTIYDNLLKVYNEFNNYNCDKDLADGKITEDQCKYKHMLRQRLVIFKYIYRAYITCNKVRFVDSANSPTNASMQGDPWHFIFSHNESIARNFNTAYNDMLYDRELLISSPGKSPKGVSAGAGAGATASVDVDATTKGEYEAQLGEVAIDDTFTYNSDETGASCDDDDDDDGKTGRVDCGKRGSETREHVKSESDDDTRSESEKNKNDLATAIYAEGSGSPAISDAAMPASTKDEQPNGWIVWLIKKLDANRRDMFGGRSTRKRKRSKIPRRTIRQRAQKRTQKHKQKPHRTIRRRRRNKKSTQKRRK